MQINKTRHRQPTPGEQLVLDQLTVRLVQPHEVERFDRLITAQNYLKNARVVGEHLRYAATLLAGAVARPGLPSGPPDPAGALSRRDVLSRRVGACGRRPAGERAAGPDGSLRQNRAGRRAGVCGATSNASAIAMGAPNVSTRWCSPNPRLPRVCPNEKMRPRNLMVAHN